MVSSTLFRFAKQTLFLISGLIFLISCTTFLSPAEKQDRSSIKDLNPSDRFAVYENGVVFDTKTALEWYAGDITKLKEQGTRYWLSQLNNRDQGWRLPTRDELYDLNQNGRKYCKTLRLTRDIFWVKNYRVYDLITNIEASPRSFRFRHGLFIGRHNDDGDDEIRAHILVVRPKP